MNEVCNTPRVKIVADINFDKTELHQASGIVMGKSDLFFNVLVTSGKYIGQTHRFLESQLQKL